MRAGGGLRGGALALGSQRTLPGWLVLGLCFAGIQLLLIALHLIALHQSPDAADPGLLRRLFNFNQEATIPTLWSAMAMLAAAAAGAAVATRRTGSKRRLWQLLAVAFVWLALEEQLLHLHEDSQVLTGVDWPLIYLPALVGGLALLRMLAIDAGQPGSWLLLAGAGAMAAGVGAELLSSPSIALDYDFRNVIEENLELAGVALVACGARAAITPRSSPLT